MTFWIDAHLSPKFAKWLASHLQLDVKSLDQVGLREADDRVIFEAARAIGGVVVITKDEDFINLVTQRGPPPQTIWVTCGNTSTTELITLFTATFAEAHERFAGGEAIVEIS